MSDATTVVATTKAAEMARPETNETPITSIPRKEITTVTPAKVTARPAVSIAMAVASSDRVAVVEVLAVPGDDEERVVDAHAEADHQAEELGEVGNGEEVRGQEQERRCRR